MPEQDEKQGQCNADEASGKVIIQLRNHENGEAVTRKDNQQHAVKCQWQPALFFIQQHFRFDNPQGFQQVKYRNWQQQRKYQNLDENQINFMLVEKRVGHQKIKKRGISRNQQRIKNVGKRSKKLLHCYIFLRMRATGMSSCSRYLAMVRRAIG